MPKSRDANMKFLTRLRKTPISHTPEEGKPYWTQDGQGYKLDPIKGGVVKTTEPAPEGYLEERRKARHKQAKSLKPKKGTQ